MMITIMIMRVWGIWVNEHLNFSDMWIQPQQVVWGGWGEGNLVRQVLFCNDYVVCHCLLFFVWVKIIPHQNKMGFLPGWLESSQSRSIHWGSNLDTLYILYHHCSHKTTISVERPFLMLWTDFFRLWK